MNDSSGIGKQEEEGVALSRSYIAEQRLKQLQKL